MTIDAVIFDLDGTLADTLDDIATAANRVLAGRGLPTHRHQRYRAWIGEGVARLMARAMADADAATVAAAVADFESVYAEVPVIETAPYPGVVALLDHLSAAAIPLAVLSNKPASATRRVVAELFPATSFGAVVGYRKEVPRKPDPTSALAVAARLGVAPPHCVLVGDTATDMATALAAGMVAVGVSWGFRDRAELMAAGAERVIDAPAELIALLD